ncbi:MAG: hypothetical protein NVSMB18_22340 [Acetobacteraceae bacterium]
MTSALVPAALDAGIKASIATATAVGLVNLLGATWPISIGGHKPLFIKFMSATYGARYAMSGPKAALAKPAGLFVSSSAGFTWGQACYATPLLYPVSTAIYGRCGIVAEADPTNWQLFDATSPTAQQLYLDWVRSQPYSRLLMLTTHSQLANQFLRNTFRTQYRIDCVVFPPDESNPFYTRRGHDRWLAVSEWGPAGDLAGGFCSRFTNPRLAVILAEEFELERRGLARRAMIGPMAVPLNHLSLTADIATAYNTLQIATVTA